MACLNPESLGIFDAAVAQHLPLNPLGGLTMSARRRQRVLPPPRVFMTL
jgi:hypothetical protein